MFRNLQLLPGLWVVIRDKGIYPFYRRIGLIPEITAILSQTVMINRIFADRVRISESCLFLLQTLDSHDSEEYRLSSACAIKLLSEPFPQMA